MTKLSGREVGSRTRISIDPPGCRTLGESYQGITNRRETDFLIRHPQASLFYRAPRLFGLSSNEIAGCHTRACFSRSRRGFAGFQFGFPNSKLEKVYFNTNVYNAIPHWTLTYCFPLTM